MAIAVFIWEKWKLYYKFWLFNDKSVYLILNTDPLLYAITLNNIPKKNNLKNAYN